MALGHRWNGLEDPWPVSRCCLEPRWFVGDPTLLARDNIKRTLFCHKHYPDSTVGPRNFMYMTQRLSHESLCGRKAFASLTNPAIHISEPLYMTVKIAFKMNVLN